MADRTDLCDDAQLDVDVEGFDEFGSDPIFLAALEDAEGRHRLLVNLVAQRKAMHMSQKDVAREMQTTQSAISELESGSTDPHLSTLQRYARAVAARLAIRVDLPAVCPWQPRDVWVTPRERYTARGAQVSTRTWSQSEHTTSAASWLASMAGRNEAASQLILTA